MKNATFNLATVQALLIVVSFLGHLPLVAGLVTRRDRGWRRIAYWGSLACWVILVITVTHVLRSAW